MDFRIADTFTDSLARLTGDEQKAVKTTAFRLGAEERLPRDLMAVIGALIAAPTGLESESRLGEMKAARFR